MSLSHHGRDLLLEVARRAVEHALDSQDVMEIGLDGYPRELRAEQAAFVTLRHGGELTGCVGSLRPARPLVRDVARNAHQAALCDPRFPPLERRQLPGLAISISVLGPLERLAVRSENELILRLRPGIDGLVLQEGDRVATFLPVMWKQLPEPRVLIRTLKEKAGWPRVYWSRDLQAFRYTAETIA